MKILFQKFWSWYERHQTLNLGIAAGLFIWQVVHLYWLTTDVVMGQLLGSSFFSPSAVWRFILIIVDYTEIPALLTTSLVYLNELRKRFRAKPLWYLFFLNSQWLHIFWITDEFILSQFTTGARILPLWLAWLAIALDYLELPVIYDATRKFFQGLTKVGK